MRRIITGVLLLITLITFTACFHNNNISVGDVKPIMYASLTAPFSVPYGFVLYSDGNLVVYHGGLSLENLKNGDLKDIDSENTFLNNEEFSRLKNIIDGLDEIDGDLEATDYWEYCVTVNGKTYYNCTYGMHKNYDSLIKELINLSSINIVSESGAPIEPIENTMLH